MNTSILMRHSEIWVNELQNESYKIDGIVVGDSISFSYLKAAIVAELDIDVSRKEIEIRDIIEGISCLVDVLIYVLKIVIMYHSLSLINASSTVLDDTYRISVYSVLSMY